MHSLLVDRKLNYNYIVTYQDVFVTVGIEYTVALYEFN